MKTCKRILTGEICKQGFWFKRKRRGNLLFVISCIGSSLRTAAPLKSEDTLFTQPSVTVSQQLLKIARIAPIESIKKACQIIDKMLIYFLRF